MDLNNLVLYSKYWYEKRKDAIWMDLAHCIYQDYMIQCYNKEDVYRIILHEFDKHYDFFKRNRGDFGVSWLLIEVHKIMYNAKHWHNIDMDIMDATFSAYLSLVSSIEGKAFDKVYKPADFVLPLSYHPAYCCKGLDKKFRFADMRSDVDARINKFFPDGIEQEKQEYSDYYSIERSLCGKSYEDVQTLVGYDAFCDEVTVTGDVINNKFDDYEYNDLYVEMGVYNNIKTVDESERFKVKLKRISCSWGDHYEVRLIEKL